MTPAQAKTYNDVHIRQKTDPNSITTGEVATAIDQAIDSSTFKADADEGFQTTENITFLGSVTVGSSGSEVTVPQAINSGYVKRIDIDQPNTLISIKKGNGDSGAIISRPTQNNGEMRINSAATVDGSSNPLDGFINFQCSSADVMKLYKYGLMLPGLTTTERNAIVSPLARLLIYNSTSNAVEYYNGSTWINLTGSGGSIDYSIHNITYSGTPTMDGNDGINFTIDLTGDATFTLQNFIVGKDYYLTMVQKNLGGHVATFPGNSIAPLGVFSSGQTLNNTSTLDAQDDVRIRYDGTNYRIYLDRDLA